MKILYHHRTRSNDGQRVHIDGLVEALRRLGQVVRVVGPGMQERGANDHRRTPKRWLLPLRELAEYAYNLVEIRALLAVAREFQPDALYSRHSLFCVAPSSVARRLRIPWIVEVNAPLAEERRRHGGLFWTGWALRRETRTLNSAARVIVVTQVMKRLLIEQGVAESRIEVHSNGVDPRLLTETFDVTSLRRELGVQGSTVLGFVGFVREWNRIERVFPFLKRTPNAVLLVVGDGPDVPRLERIAGASSIKGQVRFLGALPAEKVQRIVAVFDVAILPETPPYASPLKLLDYMARGCAILAPDRPNLRETLEHERNALLFDAEDDTQFDAQLERLLRDLSLRRRLGQDARATIDRLDLTWDHNARRVHELFESLGARAEARA